MLYPGAGAEHLRFRHVRKRHEHSGGQQKIPALIGRIGQDPVDAQRRGPKIERCANLQPQGEQHPRRRP